MPNIEMNSDGGPWEIALADRAVAAPRFARPNPAPVPDVAGALRAALEHPIRFEPLRRALTPDDRITVVLDPDLPEVETLLRTLVDYLAEQGIAIANMTILAERETPVWASLSAAFPECRFEIHTPDVRDRLAYLANTATGRRIYLNRAISEADQTIVLARRGYDALLGQTGPETLLFPGMTDRETKQELWKLLRADLPMADEAWPLLDESREIGWLIGIPFLVHIMQDAVGSIVDIRAGVVESAPEIAGIYDGYSRGALAEGADAALLIFDGGDTSFRDLALGLLSAARAVKEGGVIALVTAAALAGDESVQRVRSRSSARDVVEKAAAAKTGDPQAIFAWASAVQNRRVYLVSDLSVEATEGLFATKLETAGQLERLLEPQPSILVARNPQRQLFELGVDR